MSELKNMGIPITLDIERELVYNINVLDACKDKFSKIDDILNVTSKDMEATVWLAVQMLNEGAEIWNEMHPDNKIPLVDEKKVRRYAIGLGGIVDLQKKVQEALLKGLPEDKVVEVEEMGKNLIAAQMQKQQLNGEKMNRAQRRSAKK